MVFVHGLVCDFTHFEHIAAPLSKYFRVAGLDFPGCGISCKPEERHTIQRYASALLSWMDARGIERANLVGHSAGAQVVAEVARLFPERVLRLVLIGPSGIRRYPASLRLAARALVRPALLSRTLDKLAMPMLDRVFVARNLYTEKFVKDALDRPIHPTIDEMAKVFHDLVPDLLRPSILKNAKNLRMPILLIWGEQDLLIPQASVAELVSKVPVVKLKRIPRCGHLPMIECPDEVVRAIEDFCVEPGMTTRTGPT